MDLLDINIVIAPPEHIAKKARYLSRQLKKQGTLFTLGRIDHFPHISIYMCRLPLANLEKAQKELSNITASLDPFPITAYRFRNAKRGYIDIRYYRNLHLRKLQQLVIDAINPLRKGALLESDLQKITTYPLKLKRMVEKYGYRSVGKEYYPHLSLTRLANQLTLPQMTTALQWQDMAFTVNKVGIYLCGENGTCRRLIKMYHLNG
jgi:2'-5' RNA ligase